MRLIGHCKACGKCCSTDVHWLPFSEDGKKGVPPFAWVVEQAQAKGFRIVAIGNGIVMAEYDYRCPKLDCDYCTIHGTDEMPKLCMVYPADMVNTDWDAVGIDPNKALPEGCGYRWVS